LERDQEKPIVNVKESKSACKIAADSIVTSSASLDFGINIDA
jgi:hypothetical protein